jgi:hypothetical protein
MPPDLSSMNHVSIPNYLVSNSHTVSDQLEISMTLYCIAPILAIHGSIIVI